MNADPLVSSRPCESGERRSAAGGAGSSDGGSGGGDGGGNGSDGPWWLITYALAEDGGWTKGLVQFADSVPGEVCRTNRRWRRKLKTEAAGE